MTLKTSNSPEPHRNPEPILPALTYDAPVTPTFMNVELNTTNNNQHFFNSPTTSEFNNAAFMLMSNIDNNTHNLPQTVNTNSPSYFLNITNTPPPQTLPSASALDFESIGQLLMSPNNNGTATNINIHDTNNNNNNTTTSNASDIDIFTQTIRFNNDPIFKDYHTILPKSFNSPISFSNLPSPISTLAPINTIVGTPASTGTFSATGLGIDINSTQNADLLSNTEALALESFLDSIANEGVVKSKLKSKVTNSKKRTLRSPNTSDNQLQSIKQEDFTPDLSPKGKQMKKEPGISDVCVNKKQLSKQERKVFHNITEQKRRDMIKEAFDKLNSLVQSSIFDLRDQETLKNQVKKRKRKSTAVNKRPMKKFEVLSRSVREIQILVERNKHLYNLLNESEKENPIINVNDKFQLLP